MKQLPLEERPREKLRQHGPSVLTDSELLAIIVRTGNKKENVLSMSSTLLEKFNLKKLSRATPAALQKTCGIGEAKACQIAACFELGRRVSKFKQEKIEIKQAKDIVMLLQDEVKGLTKEHLKIVLLDTRKRIIRTETVFIGSLNESIIHPREIFQRALEESAAALILVHNHPSGDPTPSVADIESTKQIQQAGIMIDIPVLDHIIIGDNSYRSMYEEKLL